MPVLSETLVKTGAGEARWWFGALAEIKATSQDTGGQFTLVEVTVGPNYQGVRHVHHNEDEAFWVLGGDVDLQVGEVHMQLAAGDYAFGPRDIPHAFVAGAHGCQMLFLLTPGGFEDLVIATSEPAATRTLPPPSDEMPDIRALNRVVAKYGGEILI